MLVWLIATLICLPVLFLLADVVREFDDGSGIGGLIARGLGPGIEEARFGSAQPLTKSAAQRRDQRIIAGNLRSRV